MRTTGREPRPFRLSDALVLVAATAVGLTGVHRAFQLWRDYDHFPGKPTQSARDVLYLALTLSGLLKPMLAAWTPTVLLLRLRRPRESIRRLFLRPGAAVCGAVTLNLAIWLSVVLFRALWGLFWTPPGQHFLPSNSLRTLWEEFFLGFMSTRRSTPVTEAVASSVLSVWGLLAVTRLCRPEPSWLDRTGRAIGACWVGLFLCRLMEDWLPY